MLPIDGLPPGVQASVAVTGPHAYNVVVGASDTLSALAPGTYTIVASEVTEDGNRFAPAPATQTVVVSSGAQARATGITYAIASARLVVTVIGLPAGAPAGLSVSGPGGFSLTVDGTTTLDLLEPGDYGITANEVDADGRTYRPAPVMQQIALAASVTPAAATVDYGAGSAALTVTIAGLPAFTGAQVTVTGPGDYTRSLASTATLQHLDAGTYTIEAGIVGSNLTTHAPSPATQTFDIVDGEVSGAAVAYGSTPLALGVELVVEGLTQPVFLTAPEGDARLFLVERPGRILIVQDGTLLEAPFLDITARVNGVEERGLLGMTFDPQYATTGLLYVYYVALNGQMVVERFGSTPGSNVASNGGEIVISIPHGGENHHGGLVAFGPDGMLYVAPGDGGCCGDPNDLAQNTDILLGKVLRIDVRSTPYAIPADNPFVGRAGTRPEIWALGLRNPWRFSFDRPAGMLYISDVGDNAREEINVAAATAGGLNYGWRMMEGSACHNPPTNCNPGGLTLPVHEYLHTEGCSVIGGDVYRGAAIPELTGHYLYSDFCAGWLRSFRYTSGGAADHRAWGGVTLPLTVSFGRDGAGEAYMIARDKVWRIVRE
ncbi:MAG TPA: PQQ-dependent sugar dehydrogenase [Gemmatimonadaceae bacterium]|nr:PQQ-dependent sugar dehydrogenase [Gemmatimonadaceae bacterium]